MLDQARKDLKEDSGRPFQPLHCNGEKKHTSALIMPKY